MAKISMLLVTSMVLVLNPLSHAQSACEQLGVDCHIERHTDSDNCDSDCRLERHREAQKEDRERAEYNEKVRDHNQAIKNDNKARELGAKAYQLQQSDTPPKHENCRKAIELYLKALDHVDNYSAYYTNAAVCAEAIAAEPQTSVNDQWKYDRLEWAIIKEAQKRNMLTTGQQQEAMWNLRAIEWRHGRRCPEPPAFNGTHEGCSGNPEMRHDSLPYVPMPIIDGKNWTLRNIMMTKGGHFTITTTDGHVWHEGDNFVNTPMMNSRIQTDASTTVRLTLPDGHDYVISPDSDVVFDSFVYDPNESTTTFMLKSLKGLFRFVTGQLQNAFPQIINMNVTGVDCLGIRGTDVEVFSQSLESPDILVYNHDGVVEFKDGTTGKITNVPKGYKLKITLDHGRSIVGEPSPMNERDSKVESGFSDNWDMTPFKGRELQ